ncbi:hypothetical protein BGZ60DRAFT_525855 [Tricladium varicosporioides]|nr:hypothetical protein BGZ60DRAFT_525855 [Hymenoscyphus varicosporioides]
MQLFSNNSVDHLAFYDTTGMRLKNVVVGGGRDLCMCFSLAQGASVTNGIKGDIYIYVDGTATAQVWWSGALDHFLASSYRPGAYKALPACGSVDLDSLKASWPAIAAQPSVTEVVSTLANVNIGNAKTSAVT